MMKPENLDRILGGEEELVPSSGFVMSVIDRVRHEAALPDPLAFPWKRALPGMIVVGVGLVWCVVQLVQMGIAEANSPVVITITPRVESAGGVAMALGVSLLSWLVARRITGRRGMV
jgi:hypothetical protein